MNSTPRETQQYRIVLISGVVTMTVGIVMLVVGVFSETTTGSWFGFLIPAGGFFTLLGLRGRAKALEHSRSDSKKTGETPAEDP